MKHLRVVRDEVPSETVQAQLAPVQAKMLDVARENGCTLEDAFERLGSIIRDGEAPDAIPAIRLLFDVTTGLAPRNAANLHLHKHEHSKSDKFFSPERFEKPPAPKIEE